MNIPQPTLYRPLFQAHFQPFPRHIAAARLLNNVHCTEVSEAIKRNFAIPCVTAGSQSTIGQYG